MIDFTQINVPPYAWGLITLAGCLLTFPLLDRSRFAHRAIVSSAAAIAILTYLIWRLCATINLDDTGHALLSIGFYSLEALSNLSAILVMIILTRLRSRSREADTYFPWVTNTRPSVAIFIATYNEEASILDRTITGAKNQDYQADIYLLDDGRRPEIAALCERRGIHYLVRSDNRHAKAGNMNAALRSLAERGAMPEFVAILDADFVPLPAFLSRSLTLFHDENVGVVQTPQHFFNPDPLQHSLNAQFDLPDEQRFFFDTLLPAKDGWNAAFSCGTSSIVRTSALEAVGGFPTDSITEDMLLSMRMKNCGFRTVYLDEKLSLGLAPEGLAEYCTQRIRWCVGAMQIITGPDGLFRKNQLTWIDRLNLIDTLLYWTASFPFRLACLFIPIIYWFFGLTVMQTDISALATVLLPKLIIEAFAVGWYSRGRLLPLLTDASQLLIAPEILVASFYTLVKPGERPFKVTNKGGDRSALVIHWWMLWRFVLVVGLTCGGMLFSYVSPLAPTFFSDQKAVVSFWSVYNILVCMIGIIVSIEAPRRSDERVALVHEGSFSGPDGSRKISVVDMSSSGLGMTSEDEWEVGQKGMLSLEPLGSFPGTIVRVEKHYVGLRVELSDSQQICLTGLQFAGPDRRAPTISPQHSLRALLRGLGA